MPMRAASAFFATSAATAASAVAVRIQSVSLPNGGAIRIRQHFFDEPVRQPSSLLQGRADRTGLKNWPCAMPLLAFVAARCRGKELRVLELGSGCGSLGLGFAAMVPGSRVLLTDPDLPTLFDEGEEPSSTLEWLRGNVALNAELGERVDAAPLLWGDAEHASAILREPRWSDGFDLVLGSDLLYNPDVYASLLDTMGVFSNRDRACPVVLGYPARVNEGRFLKLAESAYDVRTEPLAPLAGASVSVLTPRGHCGASLWGALSGDES
jgi:predicted nicotinamide N-methyase